LAERIPLVCLGSGAALTDGRLYSSLLIDQRIVLDLGPTAIPQMLKLGVDFAKIEQIYISHLHADHMFGLPFLLLEYCVRRERQAPLYITGPAGLEELTFKLCDLAWPDLREIGFEPHLPLKFTEISGEGDYTVNGLKYTVIPMQHFTLDAYGCRFDYKDRTIAYTGDTGECEQLNRLLNGVDVAIFEYTHPNDAEDPGHMDTRAARRLAKWLVAQGSQVIATHMGGTPDPIEGVTLCEDGKTYWI